MHRRVFLAATLGSGFFSAAACGQEPVAGPRFTNAADYSAQRGGVSFLVVRNGIVLGERYDNGGAPDTRWCIGAGSRVMGPLLAGSLIADRLMNLDEPVVATLPNWALHPQKNLVSIRMLIAGLSGIAFGNRIGTPLDAIELQPVAELGTRFIDDPAPYMILCEIARRKLEARGRVPDPAAYLTDRTLAPIGCVPIGWTRDPTGAARFDTGIAVSARGWAQVGELLRREGVWRAEQLADAELMREARRGAFVESRAGFGLWLANGARSDSGLSIDSDMWRMNPQAPADLAMAVGEGGQRLYVIPSQSVVIVRQSRSLNLTGWSDAAFLGHVLRDL